MDDTDRYQHAAADRVPPYRNDPYRNHTAAIVVALTAAVAFGAIDQYLGSLNSSFLTEVSGMSAPWLLIPFLAGAWQSSARRAALVGLAATWLAVLAYVAMIVSPMEGTHLGPPPAGHIGTWTQLTPQLFLASLSSQWLWFAGGLIAGPLYGWFGYRWHARRSPATALLAVLPILLEPPVRWLAVHSGLSYARMLAFQPGQGPAVIAEIAEPAIGVALTALIITAMAKPRPAPRVEA
jgi:hypothetical protein